MKIFFHAPISQRTTDDYLAYYNFLEQLGCEHTSDFVLKFESDDLKNTAVRKKAKELLEKQENNIKKADVVVIGAVEQSVGSGYFLSIASKLSKPIILLITNKSEMPFFF